MVGAGEDRIRTPWCYLDDELRWNRSGPVRRGGGKARLVPRRIEARLLKRWKHLVHQCRRYEPDAGDDRVRGIPSLRGRLTRRRSRS